MRRREEGGGRRVRIISARVERDGKPLGEKLAMRLSDRVDKLGIIAWRLLRICGW